MKINLIRRIFFCIIAIATFSSSGIAQTSFKPNDIYVEAGGNGLFTSLNYERQLTKKPGIGARVGVGFYTEDAFYLTIPVAVSYLFKLKGDNSFIDAGLGVTWARVNAALFRKSTRYEVDHFLNVVPNIGYRKHTRNDLMWRINITPIINDDAFTPWLGISFGKRF